MKIGDQVSFLSETGGGRVAGFKGKDIVLVEDEDGFQIPTSIHDVVVISSSDAYDMGKVVAPKLNAAAGGPQLHQDGRSVKAKILAGSTDETEADVDDDPADRDVTFRKPAEERKGGNQLSAFIAFVPVDIKEITDTRFEIYFVNDSNYYMQYTCMVADGANWSLRYSGEIEPNTKLYMDEIGRGDLNDISRIGVQVLSYKRGKSFVFKPAVDIQFRIDPVKFYKLHTFQSTQFFETPALLYTIIEHDAPARSLVVDPKQLKAEMYRREDDGKEGEAYHRRYDDGKKGNPFIVKHKGDDDVMVVDLHADALLETTNGMNAGDILNYQLKKFRSTLDECAGKKGQKIVFIHGKGEGVLRRALINDLNYRYKKYPYQDASFQEYGYGATQVTIK